MLPFIYFRALTLVLMVPDMPFFADSVDLDHNYTVCHSVHEFVPKT